MAANPVMSVQKALKILDILIFDDIKKTGFRLSELSVLTGIKPNTLHNILKTMIMQNYVRQTDSGNYIAGLQAEKIGILNTEKSANIDSDVFNQLDALSKEIKERIIFAVLVSGSWKIIKDYQYETEIEINYKKVQDSSIYQKATGRVLAAYCNEEELNDIIAANGYPGENWDGIASIKEFGTARKNVKSNGFVDMHTQNGQLWVLGYPILNKEGHLIGSIGCAAPAFRCNEDKKLHIKERLAETAINIEKSL